MLLLFIITILPSCNSEEEYINSDFLSDKPKVEDTVLIPRDPTMPEVNRFKHKLENSKPTRSDFKIEPKTAVSGELLGHSYRVGNSIIGDLDNAAGPVIDLEKVKSKGASRIQGFDLNMQDVKSYTYYNFDRFTDSASITNKFSSGFSLDLGIFKIGRKKIITEVFKSATTSSNEYVFGELNILKKKSKFTLNTTTASIRVYARECLTETFKENFNGSPIGNVLRDYGPFVIAGYVTGGKALGLYAAKTTSGAAYQLHEKDLKDSIQASFKISKDTEESNVSLKFNMNNGSVSTSTSNVKETQVQIRTYGGNQTSGAIIGPMKTKDMSIDLTEWLKSLADVNTHTLIDIAEGGLVPLRDFFIEKNFRHRIEDTTSEYLEALEKFREPYIEVVRVYARTSNGKRLYEIAPVLNTRQGDKIVLSTGAYKQMSDAELAENSNDSYYSSKVREIALQKNDYFNGLAYVKNSSTWLDPYDRKPLCLRLDGFDETKAYKYIPSGMNVGYIYIPTAKVALSYYISDDGDDSILFDYGLWDWVDSLPVRGISLNSLADYYTVIGL